MESVLFVEGKDTLLCTVMRFGYVRHTAFINIVKLIREKHLKSIGEGLTDSQPQQIRT